LSLKERELNQQSIGRILLLNMKAGRHRWPVRKGRRKMQKKRESLKKENAEEERKSG